MSGTEWLSEGAEDFLAGYSEDQPVLDLVIVGSGYGGAVAAARLAGHSHNGRPLDVVVLERGKEYVPGDFPRRFADLPGHVRINNEADPVPIGFREGLFDLRAGAEVSALVGNGLGGGSLINAGVLAEPTPEVFGARWPQALRDKTTWLPYYERVRGMLAARKMPLPSPTQRSPYSKPAKLAALEVLGTILDHTDVDRRAEVAVSFEAGTSPGGVRQQACLQCGDCFTGCNHWAKNTLAMNYLPYARTRGARLVTGLTVLSVEGDEGDWRLEVTLTNRSLAEKYMDKSTLPPLFREKLRIRARRVILAAGTYGSTEILLRSQRPGRFSGRLGEGYSTNGDMIAAGFKLRPLVNACGREGQSAGSRNVGPTITGILDLRAGRPLHEQIAIEEMAAPAALRRMLEETVTNLEAFHALVKPDRARHESDWVGQDPAAIDDSAVDRTALYAIMGHDEARGRLSLIDQPAGSEGGIAHLSDGALKVTRGDATQAIAEQPIFQYGIDRLRAAHDDPRLGGTLLPNPLWDPWPPALAELLDRAPRKGLAITVHPLGGCGMGDSAEAGVVNHLGQVYRSGSGTAVYETLLVLDGSVVPTSLGINPALTIAAIAERATDHLCAAWQLQPLQGVAVPLPAPPHDPTLPKEAPTPRPTAFRFSEKLDGARLRLPVAIAHSRVPYEWYLFKQGSLRLQFTPVPDMMALLTTHPKVMTVDQATLTLSSADAPPLVIGLKGFMSLMERENSTRWRRIARSLGAWLLNRGLREIWLAAGRLFSRDKREEARRPQTTLSHRIRQLLALASHAGERRHYRYEFTVTHDVDHGHDRIFSAGDRLVGEKTIAYVWRGNPWRQWMDMELYVERPERGRRHHLGRMSVDLPYYVTRHAMQLQLTDQDSQPQAIADFFSFFAYTARVFGKIHIWSFRAPEYPDSLKHSDETTDKWRLRAQFQRLPGEVRGARRLLHDTAGKPFVLHRYEPTGTPNGKGPVLLIHGFGASGSSFTLPHVSQSLVGHLTSEGFVTWVVDLRTSIALRTSGEEWSFEQVAREDVAGAIQQVHDASGGAPVNVIAHCIGAAMFCMAALDGGIRREWIRSVVLSQLGPLVELTPINMFRGHIAAYLKHLLRMRELDVTARRTPFMEVVDRLLSTYPYPQEEWSCHQPLRPWKAVPHEVFCHRASTIYNPLFEHHNLNQKTLDAFGDLIGHVNMQTYIQTLYFATQKRITDNLGRNQFVTQHRIAEHLRFPICFLHGDRNQLFEPATSEKSHELVSRVMGGAPHRTTAADADAGYQLEIVPGYGHQDCIIGEHASRDVFPRMTAFLHKPPRHQIAPGDRYVVVRAPKLGPVLGWSRRDALGVRRVALSFVPDDDLSEALGAVTIVCRHGQPVEGYCRRHNLQRVVTARPSAPPPRLVDIDLPEGEALSIVVASLHVEPAPEDALPASLLEQQDLSEHALLVMSRLGLHATPARSLASDARLVDAQYGTGLPLIWLEPEVLSGMDVSSRRFTFAAGSCRYSPTAIDRELADRTFGRLRQRLDAGESAGLRPQMMLLTGDQIYADAYAGLFDPTSPLDRYDNQYREAWSAPNMRQLLSRLPTYMMLDDHEIRNNWEANTTDPDLTAALPAFHAYALLGAPPNPSGERSRSRRPFRHWYSFNAGGHPFFVLDSRTERRHGLSSQSGIYDDLLGPEQWKDLQNWLHGLDRAKPKFIVSPSVVAPWSKSSQGSSANALRADAWDGFPHSLNDLLGLIARNAHQNVVFVSGDYHCSMVTDLEVSSGGHSVRAWSVVSSGIYAPYPFVNGSAAEFALDFEGEHTDWVRNVGRVKAKLSPLRIRYRTRRTSLVTSSSIALLSVDEPGREIAVEFLADEGVVRERLVLA